MSPQPPPRDHHQEADQYPLHLGVRQEERREGNEDVLKITLNLYNLTNYELANTTLSEIHSRKQAALGGFLFYNAEYEKRANLIMARLDYQIRTLQAEVHECKLRLAEARLRNRRKRCNQSGDEDEEDDTSLDESSSAESNV